jgi:DNA (cytosine-5)-methyltransferase 1
MLDLHTSDLFADAAQFVSEEQAYVQPESSIQFIDLFAGIGGFHVALHSLGGTCVFASEKDAHARATYAKNFSIAPEQFNDDIRKVAPSEVPDHEILCAGFPCQPFSQAGNKKGFEDGDKSERGNLFFNILDILEAKRPKAFILENVRHLIAHDEGKTFKTILEYLHEANYQVSYKVIKASDFNVPQHRPRVFIVGFDRAQVDTESTFHFPIPLPLTKSMSTIFNAPCDKKIGFTLRVGGKGSPIDDRRNYEFYRVNGEVRRIDLAEARELMSFPKTFEFPVSKTQAMKQLGNSVCVEVVKAVGRSVIHYLDKNTKLKMDDPMQNKGEISEAYALLKIIHQKVVQYGDAHGLPTQDSVRVLKIKNQMTAITLGDIEIEVVTGNDHHVRLPIESIVTKSELQEIVTAIRAGVSTFNNAKIDSVIATLGITKRKGTSSEKADITVDFEDQVLNTDQSISIKSFLGHSPTLLNASGATNFVYAVSGLTAAQIESVNQINTKSKIKDRVAAVLAVGGHFKFSHCESQTYASNLRKADSQMPEILADALLLFFKKETSKRLADYSPSTQFLPTTSEDIHCRLRDFVKYTVFGIFPAKAWDGTLTANGAVLVKEDGSLVFYHANHEDTLKDYFYQHTYFDTPSSTRHRFGSLYKEGNQIHFKLNLQLRLESNK